MADEDPNTTKSILDKVEEVKKAGKHWGTKPLAVLKMESGRLYTCHNRSTAVFKIALGPNYMIDVKIWDISALNLENLVL